MNKHLLAAAVAASTLAGTAGIVGGTGAASAAAVHAASTPALTQSWDVPISDGSSPIALSSPNVATLQGAPTVVVGDRAGSIYAIRLAGGSRLWTANAGYAVDSTLAASGPNVYAGEGTVCSSSPCPGGLAAYNQNGGQEWFHSVPFTPSDSRPVGVNSSPAVGTLQGVTALVSGSMGQYAPGVVASTNANLPGFPFLEDDSNFSTPAIADLHSNGQNDIVLGGDSTANAAMGLSNGGHIRVVTASGNLVCRFDTGNIVQSSPAVGEFLPGGAVGIVTGVGNYPPYQSSPDTHKVFALNTGCGQVWQQTLNGVTNASPALVNADPNSGNGALQIAESTNNGDTNAAMTAGNVYLLNPSNGAVIWESADLGGMRGGVVSIPDPSGAYQDIVATSTKGIFILDGRTGATIWSADPDAMGFQNSALVTVDPNGQVGLTVAGYRGGGSNVVHYEVTNAPTGPVGATGSWPQFHHDAQLSGDAGTPPPVVNVPCKPPAGTPDGYWLAAADGGIFNFGNVPFCGSTGNIVLNKPVVGMAGTTDAGGYWLVATDGGIFTFGDAHFYGSTGNVRLHQPIVAMAPTPDGGGYWLVASDGGIFTFGDAHFYGSTGNVALHEPIVGMAATPDGHGYWLVASDGGIFSFGDARFHGSTGNIRLNQPVVGMAATHTGNGYWLVASDGGIFTFGDAHFYGSTGNVRLARPVIGMAATEDGAGYWLYASDGGIFTFGDAPFHGSTGNVRLAKPIVSMYGY